MTALRALEKLLERGLVIKTDSGLSIAQNEQVVAQNEQKIAQNEQIPKKVTKKNIINNSQSLSVSKETDRTDGQTDFDICSNCKFIILLTTKNG